MPHIRILVIDDQQSIHDDFRKIIETERNDDRLSAAAAALFGEVAACEEQQEQFTIDSAHQGQQGLAMVQQAVSENRPYPLAFVDVRMPPGWDGVETIRRLWAVDPEILIVLCTAYSDHTWEDIVRQLGRTDHLLILKKPFDNIEVRQLVMSLTRRWHLARQADITRNDLERMVAERTEELVNRSRALEKASNDLRNLNEQLDAARQAAEAANRAKSAFLANMSHEIRTPMTAILGYADILAGSVDKPEQQEASQTIIRNSNHLLNLINDILDLSKVEAGKLEVERLPTSPLAILGDVVSLMRVRAEAKGLSLKLECLGPIPRTIHVDPTRLRQILVNLVGNACKFTEIGEVKITVRVEGCDTAEPELHVAVADTGVGMTPKHLESLFQPFQQADATTTRRFGGTGLGLAISKRLATLLGGDIIVRSELGKGSSFTLKIATGPLKDMPMLDQPSEAVLRVAAKPNLAAEAQGRLDCRILLVEDGPDNQRLFSFLLRKAGADVTVVSNGREAVETALATLPDQARRYNDRKEPFDVILMDIHMPVMDGHEATRQLRQRGYTGPILALTAHAMKDDLQKCLDAGCDAFLTKPIVREQFLHAVAGYLKSPPTSDEPVASAARGTP